ncbi:MAG: type II secretion system minor pseudopilin GspH [Pseudomonadota bacterium]
MSEQADTHARAQHGVTLVEILIVLMIAALVAGIIILNAPPGRTDARKTAETFAARLDLMAQEAVTTGALMGMEVSEGGFSTYRYQRGEWRALKSLANNTAVFPAEFSVEVTLETAVHKNEQNTDRRKQSRLGDEPETPNPNVTFTPTGQTTPLEVVFRERRESIRVQLDGAGKVELSRDESA